MFHASPSAIARLQVLVRTQFNPSVANPHTSHWEPTLPIPPHRPPPNTSEGKHLSEDYHIPTLQMLTLSPFNPGANLPVPLLKSSIQPIITSSPNTTTTTTTNNNSNSSSNNTTWISSLPTALQPKAGTTWYEPFVDPHARKPRRIGVLQALLYGVPGEKMEGFSYRKELFGEWEGEREGGWVRGVVFGVKEEEGKEVGGK